MKKRKIVKPLIPAGATIVGLLVILFVGSKFELENKIKPIVFVLVALGYIALFFVIYWLCSAYYKNNLSSLKGKSCDDVNNYYCKINKGDGEYCNGKNCCPIDGRLCSAQEFMQSERILNQLEVSKDVCNKYNLITAEEFDRIEAEFFNKDNHPKGEIWVVSNALETEIKTDEEFKAAPDPSLEKSMKIVRENIQNEGKYIQFVSLGPQGFDDSMFKLRRKLYWDAIPWLNDVQKKTRMPIIRIDTEKIEGKGRDRYYDPDYEYLVKLTSTVLFVDTTEDPDYVKGFVCLRPDDSENAKEYERRTILFEMPYCMKDDYYKFLSAKKKEYDEKLKKTPESIE